MSLWDLWGLEWAMFFLPARKLFQVPAARPTLPSPPLKFQLSLLNSMVRGCQGIIEAILFYSLTPHSKSVITKVLKMEWNWDFSLNLSGFSVTLRENIARYFGVPVGLLSDSWQLRLSKETRFSMPSRCCNQESSNALQVVSLVMHYFCCYIGLSHKFTEIPRVWDFCR